MPHPTKRHAHFTPTSRTASLHERTRTCGAVFAILSVLTLSACSGADAVDDAGAPTIAAPNAVPLSLRTPNSPQGATVGVTLNYDATQGGTTFSGTGLSYGVAFTPSANGLSAVNGRIIGTPLAAAVTTATIVATNAAGNSVTNAFSIVAFAPDLNALTLPAVSFAYSDARLPLPRHFTQAPPNAGSPQQADNTPASNPITDAGATLGRVLFYDRRLSINDRVACASCHQQQFAFTDTARLSVGFAGGRTGRQSMGLTNARFYTRGRFFWDERAATLEAQVLQPIQDATEMGLTLDQLRTKVSVTSYYPALFTAAFGTPEITTDRVGLALAQFVRSLTSANSKFDQAFGANGVPDFPRTFTAQELVGQNLFNGRAGCARCHGTNAHISDDSHNTGLDATITDIGAGTGRFKAPSLRNVEVRGRYMHDGRFTSLEQVIAFYNAGVQNNSNLDNRLRGPNNAPLRLNLSQGEKDGLVAFLKTLTDASFLSAPRFSNPFAR